MYLQERAGAEEIMYMHVSTEECVCGCACSIVIRRPSKSVGKDLDQV